MDADSTTIAKDVIQLVIKSRKNLRMYPENNPIYIKTMNSAYDTFREFFDFQDDLVFKIKQREIIFDGDQVYSNPERDDNIALLFFKDGIRELTFKSGLQREELEEFFKIIALDFDKDAVDDDIVTLMWQKDFKNIAYVVDETFLTDEDNYEETAVKEAVSVTAGEDDLLRAYQDAAGIAEVRHVPIVPLSDEDIAKLRDDIDKDTDYYIYKLVNLLFEMLFLSSTGEEYQDMVSLLRGAVDYSLKYTNVEMAAYILQRTRELLNSETCPEDLKPSLEKVFSYPNSDRVIRLLGEVLDSRVEVDEKSMNGLFSIMSRTAIPGMIKILGELNTIHARKTVINGLIILGKEDLVAVSKGLNDERWYVVRNIIYVMRNIGDKRAIGFLRNKLRHNDIRVRKEIIKALGDLGGAEVVQYLQTYLDDADVSIRGLAAKSLGQTGSPLAKKMLLQKMSSSDFKSREFNEKKEFFEALSRWNDRTIVGFLMHTLKKRSLFGRSSINENRACAAYALGLMGSKESLPLLVKLRNSNNSLIREYVNTAIKRIEHGFNAART